MLGSADSREVRIERELLHRGAPYREHLHIHKRSPGVCVDVGLGFPCAHGFHTATTQIGSTSKQRVPEMRAWLQSSRAKLEASAAREETTTLTEFARRGGQHDKLAKLAQKWWDSTGHKLDDAKFKLQGLFIPARDVFEKYATKASRNAEGACLTNVWSSVILANWAAR